MKKEPTDEKSKILQLRQERVRWLIDELTQSRGMTQQQIAQRLNVPSQYLSDVKTGQRALTEPFARCLASEFQVDYLWLLGQGSGPQPVTLSGPPITSGRPLQVPLLGGLIEGDPRTSPEWEGALIDLAGVAAAKAARAQQPYVVRFGGRDPLGRLREGDLLLISQLVSQTAEIQVVRHKGKLVLARRADAQWKPVTGEKTITGPVTEIGACIGIVWGPL